MRKFHVVAQEMGKRERTHIDVIARDREGAEHCASVLLTGTFVITRIFAGAFLNPQF